MCIRTRTCTCCVINVYFRAINRHTHILAVHVHVHVQCTCTYFSRIKQRTTFHKNKKNSKGNAVAPYPLVSCTSGGPPSHFRVRSASGSQRQPTDECEQCSDRCSCARQRPRRSWQQDPATIYRIIPTTGRACPQYERL